ncbi:hypothetical protein C8F01DRAFT_1253750 [Mycena amicta]|nr:hypothetical protein C8F01DRAFT_1253750 [Mycena amicta]
MNGRWLYSSTTTICVRLSVATLYCERNTREAFEHLFIQLFSVAKRITGQELGLRPWRPDANCRVILWDGEVAQAQGFGDFLVNYNDPSISGIHSRDPLELVTYLLKSCQVHFKRNITEKLPKTISQDDIKILPSWPSRKTQAEIDAWHDFCATHPDESIHNWYAQKLAHPWYLISMNEFLSNINNNDWNITPNSTNLVESAHAHLNAQTNIRLPLLSSILSEQETQDQKHDELEQIENEGAIANHRNGLAERERSETQRMVSKMKKSAVCDANISDYQGLQSEREEGRREWNASLLSEKQLQACIAELKTSRRADAKDTIKRLREQVKAGVDTRRVWRARQGEIDLQLAELRRGDLHGVRVQGHRPVASASQSTDSESTDAPAPAPVADSHQSDEYAQYFDQDEIDPVTAAQTLAAIEDAVVLHETFDPPQSYEQFDLGLDLDLSVPQYPRTPLVFNFDLPTGGHPQAHEQVLEPALEPDYSALQGDPETAFNSRLPLPPQPDSAMDLDPVAPILSLNKGRGKRARTVNEDEEPPTRKLTRKRQPTDRSLGLSYDDKVKNKK